MKFHPKNWTIFKAFLIYFHYIHCFSHCDDFIEYKIEWDLQKISVECTGNGIFCDIFVFYFVINSCSSPPDTRIQNDQTSMFLNRFSFLLTRNSTKSLAVRQSFRNFHSAHQTSFQIWQQICTKEFKISVCSENHFVPPVLTQVFFIDSSKKRTESTGQKIRPFLKLKSTEEHKLKRSTLKNRKIITICTRYFPINVILKINKITDNKCNSKKTKHKSENNAIKTFR